MKIFHSYPKEKIDLTSCLVVNSKREVKFFKRFFFLVCAVSENRVLLRLSRLLVKPISIYCLSLLFSFRLSSDILRFQPCLFVFRVLKCIRLICWVYRFGGLFACETEEPFIYFVSARYILRIRATWTLLFLCCLP